ncbi:hypothetical protein HYU11_05130 [Candidatus Woesearchaeota archaeon]|nr:hypothetical protein [Candidatus Woesearchaeota archaeon]
MTLESLIFSEIFMSASFLADTISTCVALGRGFSESNQYVAKEISGLKGFDAFKRLGSLDAVSILVFSAIVGVGYLADRLVGIDGEIINSHNLIAYGLGTYKYSYALHNSLVLLGMDKAAKVVIYPFELLAKTLGNPYL